MQTIKDMRRFFLTFTLALFAVAASAGEKATKPSCAGFVSNRFWDNWEISAGFGINTAFSNADARKQASKAMSPRRNGSIPSQVSGSSSKADASATSTRRWVR